MMPLVIVFRLTGNKKIDPIDYPTIRIPSRQPLVTTKSASGDVSLVVLYRIERYC